VTGEGDAVGRQHREAVGIGPAPAGPAHQPRPHHRQVVLGERGAQQPVGPHVPRGVELVAHAAKAVERPVGVGRRDEHAAGAPPRGTLRLARIRRGPVLAGAHEQRLDALRARVELPRAAEEVEVHGDHLGAVVGPVDHPHAVDVEAGGRAVERHAPAVGVGDGEPLLGARAGARRHARGRAEREEGAAEDLPARL
jgi:hypothetical protein